MTEADRELVQELSASLTEVLTIYREVSQTWLDDTPVTTRAHAVLVRAMQALTVRRTDDTSQPT